ncbi:hypothetical protein RB597_006443 [Gaeumannomyces tritici]
MSATDNQDISIAIVQISSGDDDKAEVVVEVNGKHVAVSVFSSASPQQQAVEDRLISLLNFGFPLHDHDEEDAAFNAIYDILDAAETLHSALYPETIHVQLKTVHGVPTLLPLSSSKASIDFARPDRDAYVDFDIDDALPQYSSKDVLLQEVFACGGGVVGRVLVNEQDVMLCKARGAGFSDLRLPRELETLGKIDAARINSASEIRIPRLRGYVKHAELGCVIGLLREWIPSGLELSPDDPDSADISAIPSERRQKWLFQIRRTVDWLHEIGLVWGDGKIRNVVVDKDDNAWLIDFGGGWTKGWVDEDLAGTVAGDEQAIRNIASFLKVDGDTQLA